MTYVIVTRQRKVIGNPIASYNEAYELATRLYGDNVQDWLKRNLRIEENR